MSDVAAEFELLRAVHVDMPIAHGIALKVTGEGRFIFDFSGSGKDFEAEDVGEMDFDAAAKVWVNRTYVMNALLALCYTQTLLVDKKVARRMVVLPENLMTMTTYDPSSAVFGSGNGRARYLHDTYRVCKDLGLRSIMEDRISDRLATITAAAVRTSAQTLSSLLNHMGLDGLIMMDLFARGAKAIEEHNHSLALITFWTVIEKMLQTQWTAYIRANRSRDGEPFIRQARRKILQDGRSFTASIISEILNLVGELDLATYTQIAVIRRARNNWMHQMTPPTAGTALSASKVCEHLLFNVAGVVVNAEGYRAVAG